MPHTIVRFIVGLVADLAKLLAAILPVKLFGTAKLIV
jgi:hypothetical protein